MSTTSPDGPGASRSLKDFAFADLESELATTRTFLERVPEEKLAWKPHERSWTLGELATFLTTLPSWGPGILEADGLDLAAAGQPPGVPDRLEDILGRFDGNAATFRKAFARADDDTLGEAWTLRMGEEVIFTQPRHRVLRSNVISHLAHHRAQLGVYFRLLDVPVPPAYGPTADEQSF